RVRVRAPQRRRVDHAWQVRQVLDELGPTGHLLPRVDARLVLPRCDGPRLRGVGTRTRIHGFPREAPEAGGAQLTVAGASIDFGRLPVNVRESHASAAHYACWPLAAYV